MNLSDPKDARAEVTVVYRNESQRTLESCTQELESVPSDVDLLVLPSGASSSPNISIGQARGARMRARMEQAHEASSAYLDRVLAER